MAEFGSSNKLNEVRFGTEFISSDGMDPDQERTAVITKPLGNRFGEAIMIYDQADYNGVPRRFAAYGYTSTPDNILRLTGNILSVEEVTRLIIETDKMLIERIGLERAQLNERFSSPELYRESMLVHVRNALTELEKDGLGSIKD